MERGDGIPRFPGEVSRSRANEWMRKCYHSCAFALLKIVVARAYPCLPPLHVPFCWQP